MTDQETKNLAPAPDFTDVEAAVARLHGKLAQTPTVALTRLGEALDCQLFAKLENLQHTASFKERGALNRLLTLDHAQSRAGVIAMSAGNHAQGVAYHAQRLGISATIVMPQDTPFTKIERTKSFGARVMLHGQTLSQAQRFAEITAEHEDLTFVHPYDDPDVIAGQGTAAVEMLNAMEDLSEQPLDAMLVPIGGGGLMSGFALAFRALSPSTRLIGVQSAAFPSMKQALAGEPIETGSSTLAEGIAVKQPGRLTQEIIGRLVDDILLVSEPALERAVYDLSGLAKLVAEGAGAAGIAALSEHNSLFAGKRVGTIICGGNIDDRLYANLLLRGMVHDEKIIQLRIALPDRPGSLAAISRVIGEAGGNIVEVQHQRLFSAVPAKTTSIDIVMETRDSAHAREIVEALQDQGFPVEKWGKI